MESTALVEQREKVITKPTVIDLHYNFQSDGVSLIQKTDQESLSQQNIRTVIVSGTQSKEKNHIFIPGLSQYDSRVMALRKNIFTKEEPKKSEGEVFEELETQAEYLEKEIKNLMDQEGGNVLRFRNILSLYYVNPALTLAAINFIKHNPDIKIIAQHHDLIPEDNERQENAITPYTGIEKLLQQGFQKFPNVTHAAINRPAQQYLYDTYGIEAQYLTDSIHFQPKTSEYIKGVDLRDVFEIGENDIVIGIYSRIKRRKGIQFAIQTASGIRNELPHLLGASLVREGRKGTVTKDSRVIVFLSQTADVDREYLRELRELAKELNVEVKFAGDYVDEVVQDGNYSGEPNTVPFLPTYGIANIIMQPTLREGLGNNILEGVIMRPDVKHYINEYDTFKTDVYPYIAQDPEAMKAIYLFGGKPKYTGDPRFPLLASSEVSRLVNAMVYDFKFPNGARSYGEKLQQALYRPFDAKFRGEQQAGIMRELVTAAA